MLAPSAADDGLARWSPDGKKLVFVSERDGDTEIFVVTASGTALKRLTSNRLEDSFPTWSPDGKRIAFLRGTDDEARGLFVMRPDGRNARAILFFDKNAEDACCAAWSPDGTRIAFVLNGDIAVVTADGGRLQTLTRGDDENTSPSWSPDSRRIVFDSDRGDDWDLYVVPARGGSVKRLTRTKGDDVWPDWSPDGRLIAFAAYEDSDFDSAVYVMNANGTGRTRVPLPVPAVFPDWQPLK